MRDGFSFFHLTKENSMASTKSYLDFIAEVKLQKDIYTKWFDDLPTNVLKAVLDANTIDLSADKDIGIIALGYNKQAHDFKAASEVNTDRKRGGDGKGGGIWG